MQFRYFELNTLNPEVYSDTRQMARCLIVDLSPSEDSNLHPTVVTLHTHTNEVLIFTSLPSSPSTITKKILEADDATLLRQSQQQRSILVRKNNMYIETTLLPLNDILSTPESATTCGVLIKALPPRQCTKGDYLCTIYLVDETSIAPVIVTVFATELAKLEIFTVVLFRNVECSVSDRPFFYLLSMFRNIRTKSQRPRPLDTQE